MNVPLWRRLCIAGFALLIAGFAFRGQLASALIVRGDDALRNGDTSAAGRYYQRALFIDAGCAIAADRLAFSLDLRHDPTAARTAVAIATTALRWTPSDAALLADRGFAEQQLHRWPAAERDFARAGESASDSRYDHLAGRVALARGNAEQAERYFRRALAHDPHFEPARAALIALRR